jgi:hypothetical protein
MTEDNELLQTKLNLFCKIPDPLILKCVSKNSDDSTNAKYSLMAIQQLLMHDINVITELLKDSNHIKNLNYYECNVVLSFDSDIVANKCENKNIVTGINDELYEEFYNYDTIDVNDQNKYSKILSNLFLDDTNNSQNNKTQLCSIYNDKPIKYLISQYHEQTSNNN